MIGSLSASALAALLSAVSGAGANSPADLPLFHLTLTPNLEASPYELAGTILLNSTFAANDTLVSLPLTLASVATAQYSPDGLYASDASGPLALSSYDVDVGSYGQPTRYWVVERQTAGTVSIDFVATPAIVNASALAAPHFDIRNATGGLTGSMWALVPTPDPSTGQEYDITLAWDLADDQTAVFTWAEGGTGAWEYTVVDTLDQLLLTFFIVGDVKSYVSGGDQDGDDVQFGIYWLEDPPFDIEQIAASTESFFRASTAFWQDPSTQPYRVFVRVNEESQQGNSGRGSGGTALLRSFLFGYNREYGISDTGLLTLLGHELTHNWTPWAGGTQAQQSRYNEGAAEFWSLRLLWRTGELSSAAYLEEMNSRVTRYYRNSAVNYSDEQAMENAWLVRDAQSIPYGRGMIHFANLDAELRETSSASQIDDLAIGFFHTCEAVDSCGAEEWYALLVGALGEEAVEEWELVSTGTPLIVPRDGSLGPCFEVVQNGTSPTVYVWAVKEGVDISSPECVL